MSSRRSAPPGPRRRTPTPSWPRGGCAGARTGHRHRRQVPEIDDALQPSRGGGLRERPCCICVLALEVRRVQRVHQVVRGLTTGQSLLQRRWIVYVAIYGCTCALIGLRVSCHRLHAMASFDQSWAQPPPDEARCAGNQYLHCGLPNLDPVPVGCERRGGVVLHTRAASQVRLRCARAACSTASSAGPPACS